MQFDREHFSEVFVDLKWFESKVGNKYLNEAAGVAAEEARSYKEKKKSKVAIFYMSFHFVSCKSKPDFPFFSFSFL
jgi:hypothetical protein